MDLGEDLVLGVDRGERPAGTAHGAERRPGLLPQIQVAIGDEAFLSAKHHLEDHLGLGIRIRPHQLESGLVGNDEARIGMGQNVAFRESTRA
jgi:hypothetical protein